MNDVLRRRLGWAAVISMGMAGAAHIKIAPEHLEHTLIHGAFFGLLGLAQLAWTAANFWQRDFRSGWPLRAGLALSGGVIVLWLLSHLIASPFSAEIHPSDAFTPVTKLAEAVAFGALIIVPRAPARRLHATRAMLMVGAGAVVWGVGMALTPLFPALSAGMHDHAVVPTAASLSSAAYFSIVNAGMADRLVAVTSADADSATLHQTTVGADDIARMRSLDGVDLTPHVRVDFSPAGSHLMLDGLVRELYEGDELTLMLTFASGKTIPVVFTVTMLPPDGRLNFAAAEGFQISNAWVRATTSGDGTVAVSAGDYEWRLPQGFPLPRVPDNNPMTEEKVELGRRLFYDPRLSGNGTLSCSSCHLQALAFTDGVALSVGSTGEIHPRNAQTLTNTAYNATFTWANPTLLTLERQIPIPMFGEHPVELGITGNEAAVLARLRQDERYLALFAAAFPAAGDPFTFNNITLALASFNRTLISGNSPYDLYLRGNRDALSEAAKRGMSMFFSESLECHHCHTGFNMTLSTVTANSTFEERPFFNTGLFNIDGTGAYPPDNTGIHEITNNPADMGRFRPPTLRNIALTAPYMHDGSIASLREVIMFYMNGGRDIPEGDYAGDGRRNPYKNGFVSGFTLTENEIDDLVAYLESLTDEHFITDPRFSDPFVD